MSEEINQAKASLEEGEIKKGKNSYISGIKGLIEAGEDQQASEEMINLWSVAEQAEDNGILLEVVEASIEDLERLNVDSIESIYEQFETVLEKTITIYRTEEDRLDKVGELSESLAKLLRKQEKDDEEVIEDAANSYGQWAIKILIGTRSKTRQSILEEGENYIEKAIDLFNQIEKPESIIPILTSLSERYLDFERASLSQEMLEKAIKHLEKYPVSEEQLTIAVEQIVTAYNILIEHKISDILNPEEKISDEKQLTFENNEAIPILKEVKKFCSVKNIPEAIVLVAQEISLIGLAIFEKGYPRLAIPYYRLAQEYFLLADNDEKTKEFGEGIITLGLQLYKEENYPIGRDFFNIVIEIGQKIDRTFELSVYQKQIAIYLKQERYQLAIEVYRRLIDPLQELPDNPLRQDIPSEIRQLARERFDKNDFHYSDQLYRLCADFFIAMDQKELAAETLDSAWEPMFDVRQLQTGIDLAQMAAETYIEVDEKEKAAEVYYKLAVILFNERHYDIALQRLRLAADITPTELREQKFKPYVELASKYAKSCLKKNDIINAKALWGATCEFSEIYARAHIQREEKETIQIIQNHLENIIKLDDPELYELSKDSVFSNVQILDELKRYELAGEIAEKYGNFFFEKELDELAAPIYELAAKEYIKASKHLAAAELLQQFARHFSNENDFEETKKYYLLASIENDIINYPEIVNKTILHCFETANSRLEEDKLELASKTYELTVDIAKTMDFESAGNFSSNIAKSYCTNEFYEEGLNYFEKAIEFFKEENEEAAIRTAAEVIERGRSTFQKNHLDKANKFIQLGLETLLVYDKKIQAAQTSRIEGDRYLQSERTQIGLHFLRKAIDIYKQLDDLQAAAEIHFTLAQYFIKENMFTEGLKELNEAGSNFLKINASTNLKQIIKYGMKNAERLILEGITPEKEEKERAVEIAVQLITFGKNFSQKLDDQKLTREIIYTAWQAFIKQALHDPAYQFLEDDYQQLRLLKASKEIDQTAEQIIDYAISFINEDNLIPATKYLDLTIQTLQEIDHLVKAAEIAIQVCEIFLQKKNYEVSVSWGIRGAEILTQAKKIEDAIQFLEEEAEQLIAIDSIENAILCFGKIAKILEEEGRSKEIEEIALKIMAFGTAKIKQNKRESGERLWEVALTIGAIVGEEFTGRLCQMEGQTLYEINEYEKSLELFNESLELFKRSNINNRLKTLGKSTFNIASEVQSEGKFDYAFKILPIAFEALSSAEELLPASDNLMNNARNFIQNNRDKEGLFLINTAIEKLFNNNRFSAGIERCFRGASLLIEFDKTSEGSQLIDKGMEQISQINKPEVVQELADICKEEGIELREKEKLEASHVMLATGVGVLRTINDLTGIGEISIELGHTLIQRQEMNAAVEAYRNGIQLLTQGGKEEESLTIANEIITNGRKFVDQENREIGIPLVELAGELFIFLEQNQRIMMISEIFINQGSKMLQNRNYDIAALFFSKSMEFAQQAELTAYLPKVGTRFIDFGLKLIKEGDTLLGIQFMNTGAELIAEHETKLNKTKRPAKNFIEAIEMQIANCQPKDMAKLTEVQEEEQLELLGQMFNGGHNFFVAIDDKKSLVNLSRILISFGKELLLQKDPRLVRRIFEYALTAAYSADNKELPIEIASIFLEHVKYLVEKQDLEFLHVTINQAQNIYLEIGDLQEIQKFIVTIAETGKKLAINEKTRKEGMKVFTEMTDLAIILTERQLITTILPIAYVLDETATEQELIDLAIFARQCIVRLIGASNNAGFPLSIVGSEEKISSIIQSWYQTSQGMLRKKKTFDQAIKIIDQALQLAVLSQQTNQGLAIFKEIKEEINDLVRKNFEGVDVLYEILEIGLNGLNERNMVIRLGKECMDISKEAAEKKERSKAIDFIKTAGRIFAVVNNDKLIADVAIMSASIGDRRLQDKRFKEGLHYYSAALENYDLSQDEESIQLIASSIEKLFGSVPQEDGYVCFYVPGMVYANRDKIEQAENLARLAMAETEKMIASGTKELIFQSIPYLFAAADIYRKTGNFVEETKIYDIFMFRYLIALNDSEINKLFIDLLIRSIEKKLLKWDFNAIENIFKRAKEQRIAKDKNFNEIVKTIEALENGRINQASRHASEVNILFQRNIQEFKEQYKVQLKEDIHKNGKINIYRYKEEQPVAKLINLLIQDLFARKEITGKYFPRGLFVTREELDKLLTLCDEEIQEKGKVNLVNIENNTAVTLDEAVTVIEQVYLPQNFQARINEDNSVLYSYQQLRKEVEELAIGFQEKGKIDSSLISQQLSFGPEIIQREIEYLILEGKINPNLVDYK
jgi:hypothetical protein